MKEYEGKEHTCVTHGHRQQGDDGQREGGGGAGRKWAKGEKMGTSAIVSTIKI